MKIRREAKVGIFAFVTLLALYWGINFLRGQDLFRRNNTYYAVYDQVNGVQTSSAITIKGFKIGVVSAIKFDPEVSDKILMEFSIRSKYKIPSDSKARIVSNGLLGGKMIVIEQGVSDVNLKNGDRIFSEADPDLLEMAGSELEGLKRKGSALLSDLSETLASVNSLVGDNSESVKKAVDNLASVTGSLNRVMSAEEASLRAIIRNINTLTASLGDNAGRIDNILGNIEGFSDSLNQADINGIISDLSEVVSQMNVIVVSLNEGDGSLGKLLNDDSLYDSLVVASGNLARLIDDVKANPGRYVNISVFGGRK